MQGLNKINMRKEDFKHPEILDNVRKLILKGITYECQGTIVLATKTTCSLTEDTFCGVCVWVDTDRDVIKQVVGTVSDNWLIANFQE